MHRILKLLTFFLAFMQNAKMEVLDSEIAQMIQQFNDDFGAVKSLSVEPSFWWWTTVQDIATQTQKYLRDFPSYHIGKFVACDRLVFYNLYLIIYDHMGLLTKYDPEKDEM